MEEPLYWWNQKETWPNSFSQIIRRKGAILSQERVLALWCYFVKQNTWPAQKRNKGGWGAYKWVGQTLRRRESGRGREESRSGDINAGSPLRVDKSSAGVSTPLLPIWSNPARAFAPLAHTFVTANRILNFTSLHNLQYVALLGANRNVHYPWSVLLLWICWWR